MRWDEDKTPRDRHQRPPKLGITGDDRMNKNSMFRIWGKRLAFLLGGLLILVIVLIGTVWAGLQFELGRRVLAGFINEVAATDNFKLHLKGITPGLTSGRIGLESLSVADEEGIWLDGMKIIAEISLTDLVRGRFHFRKVHAGHFVLYRLPRGREQKKEDTPWQKYLDLPDILVNDLDVGMVRLPKGLIKGQKTATGDPEWMDFYIRGTFSSSGGDLASGLNIRRITTTTTDYLNLEATLSGRSADLVVKAEVKEAPGGLLGEILGLPEPRGIDATLQGAGPLTDWKGRLEASVKDTFELQTDLSLAAGEQMVIGAKGGVRAESAIFPEKTAEWTGRRADYNLRVTIDLAGKAPLIGIEDLSVATEKLCLKLNCGLDLAGEKIQGGFTLEALDTSRVSAVTGLGLENGTKVDGRVFGGLWQPELELKGELGPTRYQKISFEKIRFSILVSALDSIFFGTPDAKAEGKLLFSGPALPWPGALPRDLELSFRAATKEKKALKLERLSLDGGWVQVVAMGDLDFKTLRTEARARLEVFDLKKLGLPDRTFSGRAGLEVRVSGGVQGEGLRAELEGQLRDIGGLPREASLLLGQKLDFSGAAEWDGSDLHLESFKAKGLGELSASGRLDPAEHKIDLFWEGRAANPEALVRQYKIKTSPSGNLKGRVTGSLDRPAFEVEAGLGYLEFDGRRFDRPAVRIELSGLPPETGGRLKLTASGQGKKLAVDTGVKISSRLISLQDLKADLPGGGIDGNLKIYIGAGQLAGAARVKFVDLKPLGKLAGMDMAGAADMDLQFSSDKGRQGFKARGRVAGFGLGGLEVKDVTFQASSGDLSRLTAGVARVTVKGLRQGGLDLRRAVIDLSGRSPDAEMKVEAEGNLARPFQIDARGSYTQGDGRDRFLLKRLKGKYDGHTLRLAGPVSFLNGSAGFSFKGLELKVASGVLRARAALRKRRWMPRLAAAICRCRCSARSARSVCPVRFPER